MPGRLLGPQLLTAVFDCSFNPTAPEEVMVKAFCPFQIVGNETNMT